MKRFVVIGLGRFGFNLAKGLHEEGHEVIAIDKNEEKVREIEDFCSQAIVADASDRKTLDALGIEDVDVAAVSLGKSLDASTLITLYLKEMGIKNILVKALTDDHAKILERIGATDIVFPEKDDALRIAERLSRPSILEQVELMEGYGILELDAPEKFWGMQLSEADIRNRYSLSIMLIKKKGAKGAFLVSPNASDTIDEGDILLIFGDDEHLKKFKERFGR